MDAAPTSSDGIQLVGGIDAFTGASFKLPELASSVACEGRPGGGATVTGGADTCDAAFGRNSAQLMMWCRDPPRKVQWPSPEIRSA